ncbi:hypothetical protein SLW70_05460 [Flavobacterium sp. NG2]|uniref:hypothetical protein n=1 Tax=Flavobacterium sp. NG2 TaxID=3097547 RepID=UPI002A802550|nr:hypothetical protein [Flavobacterium sp. NG2]WPR72585.1 hypothetical protein SLW70_05460 [Flavobacterium sp. NG2]
MKRFDFKKRTICHLLAILFTLQSCSIYKKTSITLDEAERTNLKTLVVTSDNKKNEYFQIVKIDSNYYGEKKLNGKIEKIPLSKAEIKNIRVLNKTATVLVNTAILAGTAGAILLIIALKELDDWNPGGFGVNSY